VSCSLVPSVAVFTGMLTECHVALVQSVAVFTGMLKVALLWSRESLFTCKLSVIWCNAECRICYWYAECHVALMLSIYWYAGCRVVMLRAALFTGKLSVI
jgi:hypothetical protein